MKSVDIVRESSNLKNKKSIIMAFVLGLILSGVTVYAATTTASQVTYKNGKNVEEALNDLYTKINIPAQQIGNATLSYNINYVNSYPEYSITYPSEVLDMYKNMGYTKMRISSKGTSSDSRSLSHVYFTYNGTTYWNTTWNGSWDKNETVDLVSGQSLVWTWTNYGGAENSITFIP